MLWIGTDCVLFFEDMGYGDWDCTPNEATQYVSRKVKQQRRNKNKLAKASRKRNRR